MALRKPKLARQEPDRRSLTAATALVTLDKASSWKTWRFGNTEWQTESWRLYDIIPEHWFLANRIGNSLAQARLYVAEVDENGEETGEATDERIRQLAAVPLGTGAQRDGCLRLSGVDLAAAGECWIVGEGAARTPEKAEGSWFVVTGSAFKREGGVVKVKRPRTHGGRYLQLVDGVDILIRCWREHPNDTDQADSYARSGIVPLREIELLTKREFAELDSRLTGAGVWLLPEGIDFPRGEDDAAGIQGFMSYMQRAAAASMRDQSTASAMVPIMATVPDGVLEHLDKLKPVNFWSELSAEISPMKDKAIQRLANSAEIPAEVLTGIADSNHWTAWLISDEGIRWIKGYLGLVADALTRGFLQLAIPRVAPGADPKRFAFAFDTSTLAAKPNRLEDAIVLHDRFLISDEEAVKAGAFATEQMPTAEERARQIVLKLLTTQPDLILDPEVQRLLGLPAVKSVGLPPTADQNADGDGGEDDETDEGPPNDGDPEEPDRAAESRALAAQLEGRVRALPAPSMPALPSPEAVFNAAAKLLVYRALELAGGRLATPAERRGRWRDVPRHELHARIGPVTPETAARVTEGAWNHVDVTAADLGVPAGDLRALLQGYVTELLTRGMAHHDDLLFGAITMARRNQLEVTA